MLRNQRFIDFVCGILICPKMLIINKVGATKLSPGKDFHWAGHHFSREACNKVSFLIYRMTMLACVAVFSVSFQASRSRARARGQRWQKISGRREGPFLFLLSPHAFARLSLVSRFLPLRGTEKTATQATWMRATKLCAYKMMDAVRGKWTDVWTR